MPLDYCEECDREYDNKLFSRCPNHRTHRDGPDYDPSDAELESYYDRADHYEVRDRLEKELRETGRR